MAVPETSVPETSERLDYYRRIGAHHILPLWVETQRFVPMRPTPTYVPALWRYDDIRPLLLEAGRLVTAEEATRRVLVLQNPALDGFQGTTRSLYACLQLIMPGETAPDHRHTQSALRFIVEGEGAYTMVDGERIPMAAGDFIITPSWTWHGHGHDGDQPMVWLDGLDNGLLALLDTTFFEPARPGGAAATRPAGDTLARFGSNMLPETFRPDRATSPLVHYPFARSRAALAAMAAAAPPDLCHGHKMRFVNPATGGDAMPTMGVFLQRLPAGFRGAPYRSTDGAIFMVAEGSGRTVIGARSFAWGPRDIFVVPSWASHAHEADETAILFSFSDRATQEKLGLWREERP
ncbi:MAG: gentisate 1,2-dioxygenase [Alphaproteobacteria bacterium]|nr:gentisate 1,2-dioxygenase [Alphaproteobacteria bacterium]